MSSTEARHSHGDQSTEAHDPVDDIVSKMPIVLPLVGGVLMFLLAFIAIYMA